jgi:hypothetical protein
MNCQRYYISAGVVFASLPLCTLGISATVSCRMKSWQSQIPHQWYYLRPDALAEYRIGSQQFCFWLEWDRGTINVRNLAIKFTFYAHYIASRE